MEGMNMDNLLSDYQTAQQRVKAFEPRQGELAEDMRVIFGWVVWGVLITCILLVWNWNGELTKMMVEEDFSDTGVGCIDDCLEPAE
jgi:hypothetical protein